MNAVPRLSIGLLAYNGEKYLAALLGQTYEDFELIISDNAPTDGTADICCRYGKQDSRIRYVRQPGNIGLASNHNFVACYRYPARWVAGRALRKEALRAWEPTTAQPGISVDAVVAGRERRPS